jgi:formylglycine-generating enzyme
MNSINRIALLFVICFASVSSDRAWADTFGSGVNSFDIEFVVIGSPGNPADTTGTPNPVGSVTYSYRIGGYEISEQMIEKANLLGGLGIVKDSRGANKPVTSISWNEAARFVNWLNITSGSPPAYKFGIQPGQIGYNANTGIQLWAPSDAGYDPSNLYRNSLARYFLPSVHEWYKAAYYSPTSGSYFDHATGSNTAPNAVASGTSAGTAVFGAGGFSNSVPADISLAGGLSPFGTMGQGGNVEEWIETDLDNVNGPASNFRWIRGGNIQSGPSSLSSSGGWYYDIPGNEYRYEGFRVASIVGGPTNSGDFNRDGHVDAADYVAWRKRNGTQDEYNAWRGNFEAAQNTVGGDFNLDGYVDAADYVAWRKKNGTQEDFNIWRSKFGASGAGNNDSSLEVPEPNGWWAVSSLIVAAWLVLARHYPCQRRAFSSALVQDAPPKPLM